TALPRIYVVGYLTRDWMTKEMTLADVLKLDENHDVAFPNSVVEMFSGVLGVPPDGWPRKVQKILLRGVKPVKGRPGASMPAAGFTAEKEILEKKTGHAISDQDLLRYLLYPDVFLKFDKFRQ